MSPGVASPEEAAPALRSTSGAASFLRPVDGAGTWRHTPSHGLRLTLFGTLIVTGLMVALFVLVVHAGQGLVCRMDRAAVGHGTHSYCADWPGLQSEVRP